MSLGTATPSVAARLAKRAAMVRAQRRSGNGTVADVAEFFRVSVRQVLNWKEDRIIGHNQIGLSIWFSPDDVAELPACYHHAGKYSELAPGQVKQSVREDWLAFLGVLADGHQADEVAELQRAQAEMLLAIQALQMLAGHKEAA